MRTRGLLFTLGVFVVGGILITFAVAYDMASKDASAENRLMELERATSQNTNIAHNIRKAFRDSAGIGVEETGDSVSISEALPNNLTAYRGGVARLADFAGKMLENASVALSNDAAYTTDFGVNYTHLSDGTVEILLPENTAYIFFAAAVNRNVSSCNLTAEAGGVPFAAAVEGNPGGCTRSANVNVSSHATLDLNGGGIVLSLGDRTLLLSNNVEEPLNYNLTVKVNETRRRRPPRLVGRVTTEVGGCGKTAEVVL
jgi:hypothetical protein